MSALVRRVDEVPGGLGAIGDAYRAAFQDEEERNDDFLAGQLAAHLPREGFAFAGRADGGRLLGFGYGYTGRRGQWWTEPVAALAPADVVEEWVGDHFELVELGVVPEARGRGVGAALLAALVEGRAEQRALLGTWRHDHPARRLYERAGWRELVPDLDGTYSLWGRRLDR